MPSVPREARGPLAADAVSRPVGVGAPLAEPRTHDKIVDYYVYIVENVAQRDSSKFEVRVLHGEELRRLCAGANPQRVFVPVRVADYKKLPRLEE